MKVLLVSPHAVSREMMGVAVGSVERLLEEPVAFLSAADGEQGIRLARREGPDVVVAEETASRAGAFALALDLRGQAEPFRGVIVVLLDRAQDDWLARWSGADAWFTRPVDPFALAGRVAELVHERRAELAKESA